MNIREDIKQVKTSPHDLRKFGLMVGGVLAILGLLLLWRQKTFYPYFLWPGVVLIVFGVVLPRALKWVCIGWMSVAAGLGFVMAHVVLTVLFFLMITPIGLLARLFGRDFLRLKLDRKAATYWLPRERKARSSAEYERQF